MIPIILLFCMSWKVLNILFYNTFLWLKDLPDYLNLKEFILTCVKLSSTFLLNYAVVLVNLPNFDSIFCLFGYDNMLNVLKLFLKVDILLFYLSVRLSFDFNIFSAYFSLLTVFYYYTGTFFFYVDFSLFKVTKIDFLFE